MSVPMKKLILIFGSGRSGTSLVTNLISELGAELGNDLLGGNKFNPDGFFEDRTIVNLHKDLLQSLGSGEPKMDLSGMRRKINVASAHGTRQQSQQHPSRNRIPL